MGRSFLFLKEKQKTSCRLITLRTARLVSFEERNGGIAAGTYSVETGNARYAFRKLLPHPSRCSFYALTSGFKGCAPFARQRLVQSSGRRPDTQSPCNSVSMAENSAFSREALCPPFSMPRILSASTSMWRSQRARKKSAFSRLCAILYLPRRSSASV